MNNKTDVHFSRLTSFQSGWQANGTNYLLQVGGLGVTLLHLSIRLGTIADGTRILAFSGPTSNNFLHTAPAIDISGRSIVGYLICKPITSTSNVEIAVGHLTGNSAAVADFLILSEPFELSSN